MLPRERTPPTNPQPTSTPGHSSIVPHTARATRKSPTHHDGTANKHSATIWLEPSHAWLLHPAPAHTSGGGARKTGERASFGGFKKNERNCSEREAKPPCREGRPSRCFLATLGALLARWEAKAEQTFARAFKVQTVAVFHFSDKFLQYH